MKIPALIQMQSQLTEESPCSISEFPWDDSLKFIQHAAITVGGKPIILLGPQDIVENTARGETLISSEAFRAFLSSQCDVNTLKVECVDGIDLKRMYGLTRALMAEEDSRGYFAEPGLLMYVCDPLFLPIVNVACMCEEIINLMTVKPFSFDRPALELKDAKVHWHLNIK